MSRETSSSDCGECGRALRFVENFMEINNQRMREETLGCERGRKGEPGRRTGNSSLSATIMPVQMLNTPTPCPLFDGGPFDIGAVGATGNPTLLHEGGEEGLNQLAHRLLLVRARIHLLATGEAST